MSGIAILRPLPIVQVGIWGATGEQNMLTPSPREVCVTKSAHSHVIDIDLGSAQAVDTLYVGNCDVPADATIEVYASPSWAAAGTQLHVGAFRLARSMGPGHNAFVALGAAVVGRYFRVSINLPSAPSAIHIGVLAIGRRFEHPYAYGGGRQPLDSSRVTELFDGGFGIDHGVVKSSFKWRFTDLQESTVQDLWDLAKVRGQSRVIVIDEDIDADPRTASSVHYGLFGRFEAYERTDPRDTSWAMTMTEWV